jgi:hypothetical protein
MCSCNCKQKKFQNLHAIWLKNTHGKYVLSLEIYKNKVLYAKIIFSKYTAEPKVPQSTLSDGCVGTWDNVWQLQYGFELGFA